MPPEATDLDLDVTTLNEEPEEEIDGAVESDDEPLVDAEVDELKDDDEDEEKDEDKDEEEEDEEGDVDPNLKAPSSFKEIKAKYPTLFKDFPELKTAFFRDREYVNLFPTVQDAKEAFDDNQAYVALRKSALDGNPLPLLETVATASKESFVRFSREFLPAIYKKDSEVYSQVITPVFENFVTHMYNTGMKYGNEDIKKAALEASKFLFQDETIATGEKHVSQPLPKQEEKADDAVRFVAARQEVSNAITNTLKSEIKNIIDPDKVMAQFIRRRATEEVCDLIARQLEKDTEHMKIMRARWTRATQDGYDDSSKRKISNAYLTRARALIPSISAKVQAAALGTSKDAAKRTEARATPGKKEVTSGRSGTGGRGHVDSKQIDWRSTSDLDILNDAPVMRK